VPCADRCLKNLLHRHERVGLTLTRALQRSWRGAQLRHLLPRLRRRLGVPSHVQLTANHVESLWVLLCSHHALQGDEGPDADEQQWHGAHALFEQQDVEHLEWLDDVAFLNKRGWGHRLNYAIAVPLLQDLRDAIAAAVAAADAGAKARRLLFGHAETLAPLLCHLGLFGAPGSVTTAHSGACDPHRGGTSVARHNAHDSCSMPAAQLWASDSAQCSAGPPVGVQTRGSAIYDRTVGNEAAGAGLAMLPRPAAARLWRGSQVAPYGANAMLLVMAPLRRDGRLSSGGVHPYSSTGRSSAASATSAHAGGSGSAGGGSSGGATVAIILNERVVGQESVFGAVDGLIPAEAFLAHLDRCIASCAAHLARD
jgi:hypothetical protein